MKELGQTWGGYTLERPLGRGATAQVFLAHSCQAAVEGASGESRAPAQVALKVFHPGLWDREDIKRRAMGEIHAVSLLNHPGIIRIVETLWHLDPPAVAFQYVPGVSLEEFQARLPYILPEVAVLVVLEVLDALAHAHQQGIIHRDLKPANILVSETGKVFVGDFGLAKIIDNARQTLSGTVLGSPDFMSPEQARGETTTPRSDLFSAAAVLYFLVTGTRPFTRPTLLATLAAVNEARPERPQLRNPKLSAPLAALIEKGLARDPKDRFESAEAFAGALRGYLAEVGLGPESFSLAAWLRDPAESTLQALRGVAEALTARSERAISEVRWEEALQALSQLSLVAPESAEIPRLMARFEEERGRSRRRGLWLPIAGGVGGLALLAVGVGVWRNTPSVPSGSSAEPKVAPESGVAKRVPEAPAARRAANTAAPVTSKPAVKARAGRGEVRFDVPSGVRVFWNGRSVSGKGVLRNEKVGAHWVRLEKAGAAPIVQKVEVQAGEPTVIRVR